MAATQRWCRFHILIANRIRNTPTASRIINKAFEKSTLRAAQWRKQKFFMGGFIQWHVVVICIWCALFVTSQFDAIFMLQGEIC